MRLYFQANKKRLAIDTGWLTYNTDYFYLGAFHDYIKISASALKQIETAINIDGYTYDKEF